MSYENAPGTALVATSCAVCSRPLLDADSVEAGMGPDCRRKHGYDKSDVAPAPLAAAVALAAAFDGAAPQACNALLAAGEHRALCNKLVHALACGSVPQPGHAICAVAALGYRRLAEALARGLTTVRVAVEGATLAVQSPYCEAFNEAVRAVPGARWDRERKVRTAPVAQKAALWAAIKRAFAPGTVVIGERIAVL